MTKPARCAIIGIAAALLAAAALLGVWPWLDPMYHDERGLEHRAFPMRRVDIGFPQDAGGVQYYGSITLDVYIGRDGRTDRVEVSRADLPAAYVNAAVKAFSGTAWEPGRLWGRAVKTRKVVEVRLDPPVRGLAPPR